MDANIAVTQISSAAILVWGLQKLKGAKWFPWIQNEGQVIAKRTISIAAAIGTHTGISYVWAPVVTSAGFHTLTLTIPALSVIAVTVWHWLNQYILQELVYQMTAKNGVTAPNLSASAPILSTPVAKP